MPCPPGPSSLYAARPGARPARFRQSRLLIVGCGDVGLRVLGLLRRPSGAAAAGRTGIATAAVMSPQLRLRVFALTSSPQRLPQLRAAGVTPIVGDLDQPATLARLAGLAQWVLHLAPPATQDPAWWLDRRTGSLLAALRRRSPPSVLVYGSTTGVYGDWGGARIDETAPPRASTPRALRRLDAERRLRHAGRALAGALRVSILRIPGIYAPDRPGGTPRDRLLRGTPVLRAEDDVYTNHIHADDLARACLVALWRGRPNRVVNVCDDTELKMGDWFDAAADLYGLPRPPRIGRADAQAQLPLVLLSFMGESRRLDNGRLRRELRLRLRWPDARQGLLSET